MIVTEETELTVNDIKFDQQKFRKFGSFVEQNDALYEGSTPRELYEFAI